MALCYCGNNWINIRNMGLIIMERKIWVFVAVIALVVFFTACAREESRTLEKIHEITEMEEEMGIKMTSRGVKYIVDPDKILSGGPPKDGIPSGNEIVKERDFWFAWYAFHPDTLLYE